MGVSMDVCGLCSSRIFTCGSWGRSSCPHVLCFQEASFACAGDSVLSAAHMRAFLPCSLNWCQCNRDERPRVSCTVCHNSSPGNTSLCGIFIMRAFWFGRSAACDAALECRSSRRRRSTPTCSPHGRRRSASAVPSRSPASARPGRPPKRARRRKVPRQSAPLTLRE